MVGVVRRPPRRRRRARSRPVKSRHGWKRSRSRIRPRPHWCRGASTRGCRSPRSTRFASTASTRCSSSSSARATSAASTATPTRARPSKPRSSRELCEQIIDDAHAAGFRRIQFTGGDPLICKFLPELVERAAPLFELREIYTNGLLLDDELLDRLAPHCRASRSRTTRAIRRSTTRSRARPAVSAARAPRSSAPRSAACVSAPRSWCSTRTSTPSTRPSPISRASASACRPARRRTSVAARAFAWQPKDAVAAAVIARPTARPTASSP